MRLLGFLALLEGHSLAAQPDAHQSLVVGDHVLEGLAAEHALLVEFGEAVEGVRGVDPVPQRVEPREVDDGHQGFFEAERLRAVAGRGRLEVARPRERRLVEQGVLREVQEEQRVLLHLVEDPGAQVAGELLFAVHAAEVEEHVQLQEFLRLRRCGSSGRTAGARPRAGGSTAGSWP